MRMCLSSKPSMERISTAVGSQALRDQEVTGSLSFGRLSYTKKALRSVKHVENSWKSMEIDAKSPLFGLKSAAKGRVSHPKRVERLRKLREIHGLRPLSGRRRVGSEVENQNWGSFFVRFSWFDTEGRMEHMSPAAEAEDLQYTFDFKRLGTRTPCFSLFFLWFSGPGSCSAPGFA